VFKALPIQKTGRNSFFLRKRRDLFAQDKKIFLRVFRTNSLGRMLNELPHLILTPRLRDIGLMDFTRAKEAIAEGRACVEQALPMLRRYI
jgi:predicted acylesterase/phospholipase RssA